MVVSPTMAILVVYQVLAVCLELGSVLQCTLS